MDKDKKILKLDDIPKKNVLNAPEGYFEKLPNTILDKIGKEDKSKTIAFSPYKTILWRVAAGVSLIMVAWLAFKSFDDSSAASDALLASVSDQEIISYLEYEDLADFDLSERALGDSLYFEENSVIPELYFDELDSKELMELYEDIG